MFYYLTAICTVWGGRLSKGFCNMFSGSSPCLQGQHGSCSSAQLPVELSKYMLHNLFLNLPPQTVAVHTRIMALPTTEIMDAQETNQEIVQN